MKTFNLKPFKTNIIRKTTEDNRDLTLTDFFCSLLCTEQSEGRSAAECSDQAKVVLSAAVTKIFQLYCISITSNFKEQTKEQ